MTMNAAPEVLAARGLTKRYGRTLALDNLDLSVHQGEIYGFLGPNGAGKTTTIRLVLGLHRPTAGRVSIFGVDAWEDPVTAHHRVAYVAGEPYLWPHLTVAETLVFLGHVRGARDHEYERELLARFRLETDKKVRALSKGNRQKIQLVAALSARAELLVLDEPTSGLDPLMEAAFRESIAEAKARGQTVFLSSHIMSEVEALCDRVGILRQGRLVDEGTLDDLRHLSAQTIEATFRDGVPQVPAIEGVHASRSGEHTLRFEVTGSVGPLLRSLSAFDVVGIETREPSLEEIFLHHYAGDSA
ncbi:MAG TPA: ABC transporter ATP-binding protein [Gaiellales bacterium]|nr:ABC transporter ATP-binding protein [Gaiellales bacterium]